MKVFGIVAVVNSTLSPIGDNWYSYSKWRKLG